MANLTLEHIQETLKNMGYLKKVTGKKDEAYIEALKKFQKKYLYAEHYKLGVYNTATDNAIRSERTRQQAQAKNFKLEEMKCPCGGKYCSGFPTYVKKALWRNLQSIRDEYGKPVNITTQYGGGMRCSKFNGSTTGSITKSKHTQGKAADIYISPLTNTYAGRKKVMAYYKKLPSYNYTYCSDGVNYKNMGTSVHIDVK